MFQSIVARYHSYNKKPQKKLLGNLKSHAELQQIMKRERCRVDRNSHAFSLAVFRVGASENNGALACCLAEIFENRLRLTDEVGWLDDEHIAVVLDHTWAEGAWKFALDVSELVAERAYQIEYRVYTYASSLPEDQGDDQGDDQDYNDRSSHGRDGRPGQSRQAHSEEHTPGASGVNDQPVGAAVKLGDPITKLSVSPSTRHMAPILAKKIPAYKRVMDIIGSGIGITILSPLFLTVAIIIKLVSPGPIFFRQERVGYLGKKFRMWKFRTMQVDADHTEHQKHLADLIKSGDGASDNGKSMIKLKNDNRVIPLGNFLRKTAIDELPQLFNVFRGEMSLVGPRPPIPYEVQEYHRWHYGRLDAVPGMTGLWQVSGKNRTTFKEMVRYDIAYHRQMSLRLDARILAGTIPAIVTQIKDTL